MIDHSGIHDGALRIVADDEVSGIVDGDITIAAGCRVIVSGIVTGDVVAEPGAEVTVSGLVEGSVRGAGATLHITGMVAGR